MTSDLLCTAENFGFGPAAALERLVPHLRQQGLALEYAGCGITLDLHRNNPAYAATHALDARAPAGGQALRHLLRSRRALLSVCDIQAAEAGCAAGAFVVLYDILAWFRRPVPAVFAQVNLLLCPRFFGLQSHLAAHGITHAQEVAPLIPAALPPQEAYRRPVLLNLGGLRTPFTSDDQCAAYAQAVIDAVRLATGVEAPTVLVSQQIGARLQRAEVHTVSAQETRVWLASADLAFMTSGLGNIFDAAGQGARVCFLPPMSDSQGLQAIALRERRLVPLTLDWHDLVPQPPINYTKSKQETVPAMLGALQAVLEQPAAQQRLVALLQRFCALAPGWDPQATLQATFLREFGSDDGSHAARLIAENLRA